MYSMESKTIEELKKAAKNARLQCMDMALRVDKEGIHLGGALSSIEILVALYHQIMHINPTALTDEFRDRFIMSKGHGAPALYVIMEQIGIISSDELETFKQPGSSLTGHPSMNPSYGIEFSTGSLGQGLSLAVGSCLGMIRKGNKSSRVYVLLGDGECDEGSIWEAAMAAAHYKLGRITSIIDANGLQYDGSIDEVLDLGSLADKWRSFGWDTYEVDGHDLAQLVDALTAINTRVDSERPAVLIAQTIKGKGVSSMENNRSWHFGRMTQAVYDEGVKEIEAQ